MQPDIDGHLEQLVQRGRQLVGRLPNDFFVPPRDVAEYQAWLSAATNIIEMVAPEVSYYRTEAHRLLQHEHIGTGLPILVVQRMHGLLLGLKNDWDSGMLRRLEYLIAGGTFDEFLDHAEKFHRAGKLQEGSILASVVLEDVMAKIAAKNGIKSSESLDPMADQLGKAGVLSAVKVKRVKSMAGVRNHALHAEWDKIDLRDVGGLISGVRDLIEDHLA